MKKTFYFIRHGQTDLNLRGIVQGRGVNSPLNEMGRKQAAAFFQAYQNIPFDKVYTSTLLRTHETVAAFTAAGIPTEQLAGLDEISWGVYEGMEQDESIMAGFKALVDQWRNNMLDVAVEHGESPNALVKRQQEAMQYMLSQEDEELVLVCLHGRALRILLCHLTEMEVCQMDDFPHTNTALYIVAYQDGKFTIIDHYNTQHLAELQIDA